MTNPRPVGPATSAASTALSQSVLLGGNSGGQGQMYLRVSVLSECTLIQTLDLIYVFTACNNTVQQYKTVHLVTVSVMFIQAHSFPKGVILLVFPPTGKPLSQGTSHPSAHFHAWWYGDSCCGNGCPTAAAATGNSSHILK